MTITRRLASDRHGLEDFGPELYAPPDRRAQEKARDVEQAAADAFEGEIRRDLSRLHYQLSEAGPANGLNAESMDDGLIGRIGRASIEEIDRVILELQEVRNLLCNEGERLSHEIARYTSLSRMSMTAMKSISDSLKQSKGTET
jgi:hypothetical protein